MERFRDTEYFVNKEGDIFRNGKKLKPKTDKDGYKIVGLWQNNKPKYFRVHRIVGELYIPNIENKPEINHLDGNPDNNNINNLIWSTSKENIQHKINVLKSGYGEKSANHILKESDIVDIKKLYNNKLTQKQIANKYNVSRGCIWAIVNNKTWKKIEKGVDQD